MVQFLNFFYHSFIYGFKNLCFSERLNRLRIKDLPTRRQKGGLVERILAFFLEWLKKTIVTT